jgi:hypothetical protein
LNEGLAVTAEGNRKKVDGHSQRGLSYFQIGLRWISKQLHTATISLKCSLGLRAMNDPLPVAPTRKESVLRRKRKNPISRLSSGQKAGTGNSAKALWQTPSLTASFTIYVKLYISYVMPTKILCKEKLPNAG